MSSNTTKYEALADRIESILQDPEGVTVEIRDEETRRRLIEGGRKLAASLELPRETLRRIGYAVCRTASLFVILSLTAVIISISSYL